jgi:asparagine synthase (glutamine-hydrolysing)
MLWHDGSAIAYNGELYNFREIKSVLEGQGERFTSHSDTEVLLAALAKWHKDCLPRLDGMFAFAYYEPQTGSVLLARDIFGEKPLYYLDTPSYFAFASELHALALLPDFDPTISAEAIAAYLAFQYIPAPATIYRAVRKLEPGCWLVVDENGQCHTGRYFKFEASAARCSGRSLDELADELEALLPSDAPAVPVRAQGRYRSHLGRWR